MLKKSIFLTILLAIIVLPFAGVAQAKVEKFTFTNVTVIDSNGAEQLVTIEAGVKENNKGEFTNCDYYSPDYQDFLGYYQEAVSPGFNGGDVLDFCVNHFADRI